MTNATVKQQQREIKARYSSDCQRCGKPIVKGEHTVVNVPSPYESSDWWVHVECKDKPNPSGDAVKRRRFRRGKKGHQVGDTMESLFTTSCSACGETILKGAKIAFNGTKWVHEDCHTGSETKSEPQTSTESEPKASPKSENLGDSDLADKLDAMTKLLEHITAYSAKLEGRMVELEQQKPTQVVIKSGDATAVRDVKGVTHPIFEDVLKLAAAREEVFVTGPTGCGKTHLAQQVAEALGLDFAFVSCSVGMSEGHLTGRLLPTGDAGKFEYVISEFVKVYENGGVFLLDEVDAADSNVMLIINAALANGKMPIPNRPEKPYAKRHPDFVCIAAANTWGSGCDRQYVGRNQLDNATLDRFRIGQMAMDYDERVEKALCPDTELYNRLAGYRQRARDNRLERAISTRFMIKAYKMKQLGWSDQRIDGALFADWRKDEIAKVQG